MNGSDNKILQYLKTDRPNMAKNTQQFRMILKKT